MENKNVLKEDKHLRNIPELSAEYNSTKIETKSETQEEKSEIEVSSSFQKMLRNCLNCLKYIHFPFRKEKKNEININQSQLTHAINKIKKEKVKCQTVIPPIIDKEKTLVLDLDETLVYSSFSKPSYYDFSFQLNTQSGIKEIFVVKRFGLDNFFHQISKEFEIIIFTSGTKQYCHKVLSLIDPKKKVSHILCRQNCTLVNKNFYMKNLKILGRDLSKTIFVDDNKMSGMLFPQIFFKIQPFTGNLRDKKLLSLLQFLNIMKKQKSFSNLLEKKRLFERSKNVSTNFRKLRRKVLLDLNAEISINRKDNNETAHELVYESRL